MPAPDPDRWPIGRATVHERKQSIDATPGHFLGEAVVHSPHGVDHSLKMYVMEDGSMEARAPGRVFLIRPDDLANGVLDVIRREEYVEELAKTLHAESTPGCDQPAFLGRTLRITTNEDGSQTPSITCRTCRTVVVFPARPAP